MKINNIIKNKPWESLYIESHNDMIFYFVRFKNSNASVKEIYSKCQILNINDSLVHGFVSEISFHWMQENLPFLIERYQCIKRFPYLIIKKINEKGNLITLKIKFDYAIVQEV